MNFSEEKNIKLHREKLYKQVWEKPMVQLAKEYNISDVGLKKICKKMSIPTPPRGYWAKFQSGCKLKKQPLQKLKKGDETFHILQKKINRPYNIQIKKEACHHELFEKLPENKIVVSQKLSKPHPLIEITRDVLTNESVNDYGVLRPWRPDHLDIRVTPGLVRRSLRIMDAILKAFEKRGYAIETYISGKIPVTFVIIQEEKIQFSLHEIIKRHENEPTKEEQVKIKNDQYYYRSDRWYYVSTGRLSLKINTYAASNTGIRKNWNEGKKLKIDSILNDFMISIKRIYEIKHQNSLRHEEEEKQRQIRILQYQEAEKKRQLEKDRLNELEFQSERYRKSQEVHAFIEHVKSIIKSKTHNAQTIKKYQKWLIWAKRHIDHLNPLKRGLPFETDLWGGIVEE